MAITNEDYARWVTAQCPYCKEPFAPRHTCHESGYAAKSGNRLTPEMIGVLKTIISLAERLISNAKK